jgi:hypothetical protein
MVELYPRPDGDVNRLENRARRSNRGKKPLRCGKKTIGSRSPLITKYSTIFPAGVGLDLRLGPHKAAKGECGGI